MKHVNHGVAGGADQVNIGAGGRQSPREPIALRPELLGGGALPHAGAVRRVKLAIPPSLPDAISRPRLIARLDAAAALPLTEVIAGAGYGKTTLLAAWARHAAASGTVVWLSLDQGDADLRRFVVHLAAAIRQEAPGALPALDLLLAGNRILDPAAIGDVLADDLLDLPAPLILILDDMHVIAGSPSERVIGHLLRFPSPALRLVIGARAMPDLPEAIPLRGKGQAIMLGPDDLRFTAAEAAALGFDPATSLPAEDLVRRTDGWAAGIRALGVACAAPGAWFPESLRTLLQADVLAGQPPDLLDLLARIAPAERVSPALAAAMTGLAGGADAAAALLKDAERRGLFVTRLDEEGAWWRMHPLLRDALLADADPAVTTQSHARAADWFARAGMAEEAIDHAFLAGDLDHAATLLSAHASAWLDRSSIQSMEWVARVPNEVLDRHPALLIARGREMMARANPAILEFTGRAAAAIASQDPQGTDPAFDLLRLERLACDGMFANLMGEPVRFRDEILQAVVHPAATPRLRAEMLHVIPPGFLVEGRYDECRAALDRIAPHVGQEHGLPGASLALAYAMVAIHSLDLMDAGRWATRGLALTTSPESGRAAQWLNTVAIRVRYETGDLDGAIDLARDSIHAAAGNLTGPRNAMTHGLVRALLAQGRLPEARAALAADRRRLDLAGSGALLGQNAALEALVDLAAGDLLRATRWADATALSHVASPVLMDDLIPVTQARIWLVRGRREDILRARDVLRQVRGHLSAIGHRYLLGRVLPALAAAESIAGDETAAREAMAAALEIESGVAIRRFADAGPAALDLLARIAREPGDPHAATADSILSALVPPPAAVPAGGSKGTAMGAAAGMATPIADPPPSPSPLTRRETETLALMAEWKTNKEIAETLGISATTVREYGINIFRKLGVGDRRSAVTVARAAGWLP
jgi:LuxR family maltose regulon positive regulatory protein